MSHIEPAPTVNRVWRTDWLGTKPVFYNTQTKKISHNINDVIDVENIEFHPEGLNNYLEAGYSILGQTPVKHVKFLSPHSEIRLNERDDLEIITLPDPAEEYVDYRLSEMDIIDLLRERVAAWDKGIDEEIIVPLSGGCDSRLLTTLLPDKSKIRAYSYGISSKQEESFEVVIAQALCKKLGIAWKQIELGDFHQYFDDWNQQYGVSTHAHGMYHLEFYNKILEVHPGIGRNMLSGLGGGWGSFNVPEISSVDALPELMFSKGMKADPDFSKLPSDGDKKSHYFSQKKDRLRDYRWRKIERTRTKIMLLSYLLEVPKSLGFSPISPLMDIDVAMATLNLPYERRYQKQWLQDYFQKEGIDFSALSVKYPYKNTLNFQAIKRVPPTPLNREQFKEIIEESYIDWINRNLVRYGRLESLYWDFTRLPKINRMLKWVNIVDERKAAYFAYLTLKPLEYLLKHRTQYSNG